jgi:hypothetical protein
MCPPSPVFISQAQALSQKKRCAQIGGENRVPGLGGNFTERRAPLDRGVVDHHRQQRAGLRQHRVRDLRHGYLKFLHNLNSVYPELVVFEGVRAMQLGDNQGAGCH